MRSALRESQPGPCHEVRDNSGNENFAGLTQMTRMVEAIRNYKERVELPHFAVLLGNVWGGVSASADHKSTAFGVVGR